MFFYPAPQIRLNDGTTIPVAIINFDTQMILIAPGGRKTQRIPVVSALVSLENGEYRRYSGLKALASLNGETKPVDYINFVENQFGVSSNADSTSWPNSLPNVDMRITDSDDEVHDASRRRTLSGIRAKLLVPVSPWLIEGMSLEVETLDLDRGEVFVRATPQEGRTKLFLSQVQLEINPNTDKSWWAPAKTLPRFRVNDSLGQKQDVISLDFKEMAVSFKTGGTTVFQDLGITPILVGDPQPLIESDEMPKSTGWVEIAPRTYRLDVTDGYLIRYAGEDGACMTHVRVGNQR